MGKPESSAPFVVLGPNGNEYPASSLEILTQWHGQGSINYSTRIWSDELARWTTFATLEADARQQRLVCEALQHDHEALPVCCVACGGEEDLEYQVEGRIYIPFWVWLTLPLAAVPYGIFLTVVLAAATRKSHQFSMRFCGSCRERKASLYWLEWLAVVACLVLFTVAVYVGVLNSSWPAFAGVFALAVVIGFWAARPRAKVSPRYTVFSRSLVEIHIPGRGNHVVWSS